MRIHILISVLIGMVIGSVLSGPGPRAQSTFDALVDSMVTQPQNSQLFLDDLQRSNIETMGYFNGPLYGPGLMPRRGPC